MKIAVKVMTSGSSRMALVVTNVEPSFVVRRDQSSTGRFKMAVNSLPYPGQMAKRDSLRFG
ncbi:hypothetical protein [Rubinisphaera italica]|uniref:hypothetical protein n=1 Tax=Rubinisphaera italica TaxID=2527969 RepID=UPI0011B4AD26|nr:hypothetical protein [Rubinisphaera italica]